MDDIFTTKTEKRKRFNARFLVGILIGAVIIGAAVWVISMRPSREDQTARILADAYREGSPEFADLSKDIIISTSDRTVESPMGMGTISMFIHGRIRNKGVRTITTLEVNVAVVTQFNEVVKEKRTLVVPVQRGTLGPEEIIPITLSLDGFKEADDRANIRWKVTAIKAG